MLNDILWPDRIQWQPPTDQTLYRTRPLTEIWVVSIEHLRRVWQADRGRLLLRTPGPVPLGLAYVQLVETNPFPNLSLFYRTMLFEYPSVLSRFCFMITPGSFLIGWDVAVRLWSHRWRYDVGAFSAVKLVIKLDKSVFVSCFTKLTCDKKNPKWIFISYNIYETP